MSFVISVVNYELEIIQDYVYDTPPMIKFTFSLGENMLFSVLPEMGSTQWNLLADACEKDLEFTLKWYNPHNAGVSINIKDGKVMFSHETYTDTNGGEFHIVIPAKNCVEAFRYAQNITDTWLNINK